MSRPARRHARKRALDVLYEADLLGRSAADVLVEAAATDDPPSAFAIGLVEGVDAHRPELDTAIAAHARGWRLERMPVVDRNVLRIGLYEIRHAADVPDSVAIDEAVRLVTELSTDDSGRFVNGVLGALAREHAADGSGA